MHSQNWEFSAYGYTCRLVAPEHTDGDSFADANGGETDETAVRRILRETPMGGDISVAFTREPNFFAPSAQPGSCYPFLVSPESGGINADKENALLCALSVFPTYWEGQRVEAAYLHLLRVPFAFRGRINALRAAFAAVKAFKEKFDGPCFTSIASGNATARRLLEAEVRGIPHYSPCGSLDTLAISVRQGKRRGLLEPAHEDDIPELAAFYEEQCKNRNLAFCIDAEWLRSLDTEQRPELRISDFLLLRERARAVTGRTGAGKGKIVGCVALWDRRATRQNVIFDYAPRIRRLRPLCNALHWMLRYPQLPEPGHELASLYLAFPVFAKSAEGMIPACIQDALAYAQKRNCNFVLLGTTKAEPLPLARLKGITYSSTIYTVRWPDEGEDGCDAGTQDEPRQRLADSAFAPRNVFPEIALL